MNWPGQGRAERVLREPFGLLHFGHARIAAFIPAPGLLGAVAQRPSSGSCR